MTKGRMLGGVAAVLAAVTLAACRIAPSPSTTPSVSPPSPTPSPWSDAVPTPAPDAVVNQPVVGRGEGTVTLLPISPKGAAIGHDYHYVMDHCGIQGQIDVDGSFWDAVNFPPTEVGFDGQVGTFRLTAPDTATFTAPSVGVLPLVRHVGAKLFPLCG